MIRQEAMIQFLISERQEQGLSMTKLAPRIGCSKSSIHDWEHGKKVPSLANTIAWADALGLILLLGKEAS